MWEVSNGWPNCSSRLRFARLGLRVAIPWDHLSVPLHSRCTPSAQMGSPLPGLRMGPIFVSRWMSQKEGNCALRTEG